MFASLNIQRAVFMNGETNEANSTNYKESLYRPPTSEEINALKETENLFKSSLFRMQVCSNTCMSVANRSTRDAFIH